MTEFFVPHEYQKDAIEWLVSHENAGLFLPPGLGKTAISLSAIRKLKMEHKVDRVVVIAPIRVCHLVWPNEVKKWDNLNGLSVEVLHGPKKDVQINTPADVYCVNPDGLMWFARKFVPLVKKSNLKWMLVVDESSNFKNSKSQRFRVLKSLLPYFERKVIMTGTPAPNGLENLWPQIFVLDQGQRLGQFITQYRNRYFFPAGYMGYEHRLREGADQEIYAAIDDIVMHKDRSVLNMPALIKNRIDIEMPSSAMKTYREMKREFMAEIEGKEVTAVNAAVMGGKLKQLANGAIYDEQRDVVNVHDEKVYAIKELYDSLEGRPLMVFYEYKHDLAKLLKAFPKTPYLGGGAKDIDKTVDDWNAGNLPLLFLHPASAGHGLNLQGSSCSDIAWFSLTWDAELHEQAISRVWRQGVGNDVTVHYLVAKGTIDERIIKVVDGKEKLQNALLEALTK